MKRLLTSLIFFALCAPTLSFAAAPPIPAGSTGNAIQCVTMFFRDKSVTTYTAGLTGVAYTGAGHIPTCYYYRDTASSSTSMTLVNMTLGTWTSLGIKLIDDTNMPGNVVICLPNAAVAVGANTVTLSCNGATNMEETSVVIPLTSPNSFGYDGILAGESGTSLTLASGAIDADNQFAYQDEVIFFDTNGLVSANSCITASVASTEVVTTAEDISALIAPNDNYIIHTQPACRNLRGTTSGRTLDVSSTGEAGLDWANIGSPTTTVDLSGTSTKALEPTTAGRKLDVTTTGEAGIDWANIGAPTTTVSLSGTTVATTTTATTCTTASTCSALGSTAKSDVNAEVVDVIRTDTGSELAACPTAGATLQQKVDYLFEYFRHKVDSSSSAMTLYKDDGSTALCTDTLSDSGSLFTRGEMN